MPAWPVPPTWLQPEPSETRVPVCAQPQLVRRRRCAGARRRRGAAPAAHPADLGRAGGQQRAGRVPAGAAVRGLPAPGVAGGGRGRRAPSPRRVACAWSFPHAAPPLELHLAVEIPHACTWGCRLRPQGRHAFVLSLACAGSLPRAGRPACLTRSCSAGLTMS